jgi:hypothetical protein
MAGIIGVIQEMNEVIVSISEAMEEQAVLTADISGNVGQAAQGIAEINVNVTSSSAMTGDISEEIEGVLQASTIVQDQSAVVLQRSDSLAGLAAHLQGLVGRFKFGQGPGADEVAGADGAPALGHTDGPHDADPRRIVHAGKGKRSPVRSQGHEAGRYREHARVEDVAADVLDGHLQAYRHEVEHLPGRGDENIAVREN